MRLKITNLLLFVLLFAATASGDTSTLRIGSGAGTPCATGGCPIFNGHVNDLGSGSALSIFQNSNGAVADLLDPVLLILGVANDFSGGTALGAGSISSVTLFNDPASESGGRGCGFYVWRSIRLLRNDIGHSRIPRLNGGGR